MSEFYDDFSALVEDVKRQVRRWGFAEFIYSPRYPIHFVDLRLTEDPMADEKFRELKNCARCGETHADLPFKPLARPVYDDRDGELYTHWAPCPTNGDPIMMLVMPSTDEERCAEVITDGVYRRRCERLKKHTKSHSFEIVTHMNRDKLLIPVEPVDRKAVTTLRSDDPEKVREEHAKQSVGMHADYIVLTPEERAKGFVRPVRNSYVHVGSPGPKYETRDLTSEEHERYDKYGYIKFEKYPEGAGSDGRFWTQRELDNVGKGCGQRTSMGDALAETYARDPYFYGATYCVICGNHPPVGEFGEFVWAGTNERVGT